MGYNTEQTQPRQTFGVAREKIPQPWAKSDSHFQDKLKVEFGKPCLKPYNESKPHMANKHVVQLKSSLSHQKNAGSKTCKDGELVKHMSNLPAFLQQVEKGKNVQEKALNFGVLDWKRLEKWKYNERMPATGLKKGPSSGNSALSMASPPPPRGSHLRKQSLPSGVHHGSSFREKLPPGYGSQFSLSPQRQQPSSRSSHFNSSPVERNTESSTLCKKQPFPHGSHFSLSPQRKRPSSQKSHLISSLVERRAESKTHSRGKSALIQDFQTSFSCPMVGLHNDLHSKVKSPDRRDKGNKEQKTVSQTDTMSLNLDKKHAAVDVQDNTAIIRPQDGVSYTPLCRPGEPQNIVLLKPKHLPKSSYSDTSKLMEPKRVYDGEFPEVNEKRLSDCSAPQELHSGDLSAGIPHSCPLSLVSEVDAQSDVKGSNMMNTRAREMTALMGDMFGNTLPAEDKWSKVNLHNKSPSFSVGTSKGMEDDLAEHTASKGRHPSPNRRFSFSLGKMTRSLSFKESSGVPQLSSTYNAVKSGPVRPEVSFEVDNNNRDRANSSSRGRSSPLRRLLDPLLKHKGAQSTHTIKPSDENSHSTNSKPANRDEPMPDRKDGASNSQALLQLTVKNGQPFFKLVVDNSSDVLAATIRNSPSSKKCSSTTTFVFYSVHEIRKKSGSWMSQGSKVKSCGLGYNIVGQMKISSSFRPKPNAKDSNPCVVRESVLYAVDLGQADKQAPELSLSREVAAIVVKHPCQNLNGGDLNDKAKLYTEEGINSNSTVVILPGDIHGLPNKGAPSSLIDRYKSGGSCDCGGWDVGCKLKILANQDQSSKIREPSVSSSSIDVVNLFLRGGDQESKPTFSMEPLSNGFYSIEFNKSITLLEAFSMCVAVVTSLKLSNILTSDGAEAGHPSESVTWSNKLKAPEAVQEQAPQVPAKYVTCPPSSPVGRI